MEYMQSKVYVTPNYQHSSQISSRGALRNASKMMKKYTPHGRINYELIWWGHKSQNITVWRFKIPSWSSLHKLLFMMKSLLSGHYCVSNNVVEMRFRMCVHRQRRFFTYPIVIEETWYEDVLYCPHFLSKK